MLDDVGLGPLTGVLYAETLELGKRGLAMIGKRNNADRCRMVGYSGITLSLAGYYSAGEAMLRHARAMAEKIGDEGLMGAQFSATLVHHVGYMKFREAAEVGLRGAELLRRPGQLGYLVDGLFWRGHGREALARFESAADGALSGVFWGQAEGFILLARSYMGDRDAVLASLQQERPRATSRSGGLLPMIRAARSSGLGLRGLVS